MHPLLPPQRTQVESVSPAIQVSEGFRLGYQKSHEAQKLHSSGKAHLQRSNRKWIGGSFDILQSDGKCDGRHR